jgi:branched-chain amino acid transport system permease protein
MLGLKALYVAVIGGLNSLGGAVLGAFILGFFESMWSGYFPSVYRDVASFLALTFLLIIAAARTVRAGPHARSTRLNGVRFGDI